MSTNKEVAVKILRKQSSENHQAEESIQINKELRLIQLFHSVPQKSQNIIKCHEVFDHFGFKYVFKNFIGLYYDNIYYVKLSTYTLCNNSIIIITMFFFV